MITFVKLVCPSCGANLEVDPKLSQCFCQYCGTKILLHNENEHTLNLNVSQTTRFVDEAGLAHQENEQRRIEFEKRKYEDKQKRKEESEKNLGSSLLRVGLLWLAVFLTLPLVFLVGSAFWGLTNGGFLNFILAIVCIIDIFPLGFGYVSLYGKLKLKPVYGLILLIISLIIAAMLFRYFNPVMDSIN